MTPEERQMLADLAGKIAQTPAPARDPDAEDFIRKNIGSRPDALYLMTQTVLIQNMAIEHAQQEIQQLKQQAGSGGAFLGRGPAYSSPQGPPPPPQQQYAAPAFGSAPSAFGGAPAFGAPAAGGMGSFLRSAGTTAAGVAAGALAFEGIRSLFGGGEHMGFGHSGGGMSSGFLDRPQEVINNYYGGPGDREDGDTAQGGDNFTDDTASNSLADDLGPDDSVQYDDTDVPVDDSSSSDDLV